jgi:hypothetical protein
MQARAQHVSAQVLRVSEIRAAGLLALPFPQQPPASTLAGPPDELMCSNELPVVNSGGSDDSASHTPSSAKHSKCIVGPPSELGPIFNRDLGRVLTPMRSQIVHRLSTMILICTENHSGISPA